MSEQRFSTYRFQGPMRYCPFCVDDGALVSLATGQIPGQRKWEQFCQFHGQITGVVFAGNTRGRLEPVVHQAAEQEIDPT